MTEHPVGLRADARRNRTRVLAAAQEAFAAEGLAVPLDEIARRAGVGAGTVYRHFPTKEALFEAIVLDRMRHTIDHVRGFADAPDPGAVFYQVLTEIVEQNSTKRDFVDALAGSGLDLAGSRISAVREEIRDALGVLLRRAQAVGAVRPDVDPDDLGTLLAAIFLAARNGGELPRTALAVIRDGLRPTP
ncbi:MAG TPA: TetR family transcriptional regulator [Pseudonocardiaceae bacterium]|nr:TetR family transcriptional regulator [Pseudonocardiaceae bacterium]